MHCHLIVYNLYALNEYYVILNHNSNYVLLYKLLITILLTRNKVGIYYIFHVVY